MTGTTKESKKLGLHGSSGKLTGSTSSLNKLSVQSSGNHRSQSSSLLDMGNMSASDLDVADRARFDKIFEQVLSELEPLCLAEQDFISKFFKLQRHQSMPGTVKMKKEFIGPGLHLRPVRADRARLPLQWTLNSLLSACGNDNGRIRPPPDRGTLKIISRLLIA
ncbi:exocyst complex component 1-like [Muntiacus reevesi]